MWCAEFRVDFLTFVFVFNWKHVKLLNWMNNTQNISRNFLYLCKYFSVLWRVGTKWKIFEWKLKIIMYCIKWICFIAMHCKTSSLRLLYWVCVMKIYPWKLKNNSSCFIYKFVMKETFNMHPLFQQQYSMTDR